ncbi:hypothetical protein ACSCB1_00585 [Streptomyces europaeiscabiei]|uniref:hypothetical protein n=1 Tax=Streptomyces europaeiscabiei TaxID=146819 RepID=UPI000AE1C5B6|nr:hypothetical protein [Streptomyces europaeiscabiei]
MPAPGPKTLSAAAVVVTVATGVVTNEITDQWSWSLGAAFAILVILGIAIAVWSSSSPGPGRTKVVQKTTRGGQIKRSGIYARNKADVRQRATRRGEIDNSEITSDGAGARQEAGRDSKITDSPLDLG